MFRDRTSMQHAFESVWFAAPEQFNKLFRWSRHSDQGVLAIHPGRIQFSGRQTNLDIRDVTDVSIVRSPIPWPSLAAANAFILLLIFGGMTSFLTVDNPATFPELIALNLIFIFIERRFRWVRVEYTDQVGQRQHAYFTHGSSFGWGGFSARVDSLCAAIQSGLQPPASAQQPASGQEPADATPTPTSTTVTCDACGKDSIFLAEDFGKVQHCRHCNAYVDVDEPCR
jgi:hypothetical protein